MKKRKLSVLWVYGPSSRTIHRKREYHRSEGLTLCGIHVGKGWRIGNPKRWHKCKRCAA